jgi:hypothetical protein
MIEITEDGKKIYSVGDPPPAGREWRSIIAVAAKLDIKPKSVWTHINRYGWTVYRQNRRRTWVLKEDVDRHIEFTELRKRWHKRHKPKTWREEVCTDVDEEMCRRIFWTAEQAALYMGVGKRTVQFWGQQGKIPVFVTRRRGTGGRNWYSPSSLRTLREDLEHLQRRAAMKKGRETMRAGIVNRQVYKLKHKPCVYRTPIPRGWLSVGQVAERLDISRPRVHKLRQSGRLRGKQYYKGELVDLTGWEGMIPTGPRHWFFREEDVEEFKNSEHYVRAREWGKANSQRACTVRRVAACGTTY